MSDSHTRRGNDFAFLAISLMGMAAACCYGICHDQVTARVCIEYFTLAHPQIFRTESPTLLALGWGIVATWHVGLALGVLIALACRVGGKRPRLAPRDIVRPMLILMLSIGLISAASGVVGWQLAKAKVVWLTPDYARLISRHLHVAFMADAWAHVAAYAAGFPGAIVLFFWCLRRRRRLSVH